MRLVIVLSWAGTVPVMLFVLKFNPVMPVHAESSGGIVPVKLWVFKLTVPVHEQDSPVGS